MQKVRSHFAGHVLNVSWSSVQIQGSDFMVYGYARVSSRTQLKGNSLEEQQKKLLEAGAEKIISEQCSGKTTERPLFGRLIGSLVPGDILLCTKLDRFARSVEEGTRLLRVLVERGIKVNILNIGMIDASPIGKFMVNTLLAVAELERSMILERMAAGKEIARTRNGYREGRPPIPLERKKLAVRLVQDNGYTLREAAKATGMCAATVWRAVNDTNVNTAPNVADGT